MDVEMEQVNQAAAAAQDEATPAPEATPPAPPNPDLEAYNQRWQTVQADPQDFTSWTSLLTIAERLDDPEKIREAYDAFLSEYPLCYGYWKKYADAELRHQGPAMAGHVYERGVAATPYSADLWAHYAAFKKGLPDSTVEDVRSVYERGLEYVRTDYNSHTLWDKYLTFEQERGSTLHIASLYIRVLSCPVRELDSLLHQVGGFKNYIHPLAAAQIVMPAEYDTIRTQLEGERAVEVAKAAEAARAAAVVKAAAEAKAAEEAKAAADAAASEEAKVAAEAKAKVDEAAEAVAEVKAEEEEPDTVVKAEPSTAEVEGVAEEVEAEAKPEAAEAEAEAAAETASMEVKEEEAPAANGDTDQPMADVKQEEGSDEAAAVAADVVKVEQQQQQEEEDAAKPPSDGAAVPPPAATTEPPAPEPIVITDEEIKQVWVRQQDELYDQTKQELLRRKPFEDAARRPYFHIKPLDGVQLFNWIRYLDYVESRSDHAATVTIFERCLVACASYPEFWQRYVLYLERTDPASAKAALERAVQGFCKRRPEIYMFAAHFDERHGDVEGSRARYKLLLNSVAPRLLEAVTSAANFERRQGNMDAACHYLAELMNEEKAKDGSRIYPFLAIHYAHFLRRNANDLKAARKVLDDALQQCPGVRSLWEAAVHFEELVGGVDAVARALDLYDRCTVSPPAEGAAAATAAGKCLAERDREELSARSVDFADMYGTVEQVKVVSERHAQRFMLPTTVTAEARAAASAKRVAEASAGGAAAKVPRADGAAAPAVAAPPPPPMMPGGAAAGYYPPAAPAAAAAAAAAYSSYYGYGQYPAATQYPAYGAYPGYGY